MSSDRIPSSSSSDVVDSVHQASESQNPVMLFLWRFAGLSFVSLGVVGMVVPGLPTTVFMILAAGCFARSSQHFYNRILSNPIFGPTVRRFREGRGMTKRAKTIALCSMWFFISISLGFLSVDGRFGVCAVIAGLGFIGTLYILKLPTDEAGLKS